MSIKDGLNILERMTRDGGYLRHGCAGNGEPHYRRAARVVKGKASDASALASLPP